MFVSSRSLCSTCHTSVLTSVFVWSRTEDFQIRCAVFTVLGGWIGFESWSHCMLSTPKWHGRCLNLYPRKGNETNCRRPSMMQRSLLFPSWSNKPNKVFLYPSPNIIKPPVFLPSHFLQWTDRRCCKMGKWFLPSTHFFSETSIF